MAELVTVAGVVLTAALARSSSGRGQHGGRRFAAAVKWRSRSRGLLAEPDPSARGSAATARVRPPGGRRLHLARRLPGFRGQPVAGALHPHGSRVHPRPQRRVRLRLRDEHGSRFPARRARWWGDRSVLGRWRAGHAGGHASKPGRGEVAEAIGVGPTREVGSPSEVELALKPGDQLRLLRGDDRDCAAGPAGVDRAAVNMGTERVSVDYDPEQLGPEQLRQAITGAGYELLEEATPGGDGEAREDVEAAARRAEIADLSRRVGVGAVLTAPVLRRHGKRRLRGPAGAGHPARPLAAAGADRLR